MFGIGDKIKTIKKDQKGDLPESAEDWVKYVTRAHASGLAARKKYELQWTINLAYFMGYQELIYNQSTGNITIPKSLSRPLTINRLAAFIEARHAKLTKQKPIPRCIPNSLDKEDMNAAKYSDQALRQLWRETDMDEEIDILVMLGLITGTSFTKTVWNPYGGDSIFEFDGDKEEGTLNANEDGTVDENEINMGEAETRALSSFSIIPGNESCLKMKDQPYIIERSWYQRSDIEMIFPKVAKKLDHVLEAERTEYEKIVQRLASPVSTQTGTAMSRITDSLGAEMLVKTMWIKPNQQYKRGIICSVIGDKLAGLDVWDQTYGKNIYPYAIFRPKLDGFHFWGQSDVERVLSIQKAYNRIKQKTLKNAYLMGNGKWMNPKGSQVSEESFTDEEAEIIDFNPAGGEPHQADIKPLPNYVVDIPRELITDFRDSAGQRELSMSPGSNLVASVAMQTQAELSEEHINPIIGRLAKCIERTSQVQLILMNTKYDEPRKIQIFGEEEAMGSTYMSSVDFRNHTDVWISVESMYPEFRGAKQQRLFDFWDRRIITDPAQFLRAYRYGGVDQILNDIEKQEDPVWLDIQLIKKGKEPQILQFQDHAAYFRILSKWIQTPEFLRLIPERKELAINVLGAHMKYLMASIPNAGQEMPQQNQAATGGGEMGPTKPVGGQA